MTRAQRLILAIGLLLLAATTHLYFCDWSFGGQASGPILVGWAIPTTQYATELVAVNPDGTRSTRTIARNTSTSWGIFVGEGFGNRTDPFVWGIIVAGLMSLLGAFLLAGWRSSARRERGQCLRCGYDLKFKYEAGCPECGWRRSA